MDKTERQQRADSLKRKGLLEKLIALEGWSIFTTEMDRLLESEVRVIANIDDPTRMMKHSGRLSALRTIRNLVPKWIEEGVRAGSKALSDSPANPDEDE